MQMEKLIKKQVTLSIFSFVLISLLIIGTSSAYLRGITTTSSYNSQIGKLNVLFNNGNTISLSMDPLEDSDALARTDNIYDFSVVNNGKSNLEDIPYTYKVFLTKGEGSATDFDARFIKYCLIEGEEGEDVSNNEFTEENCISRSLSNTSTFNKIQIASMENLTILSGKNSKSYRLKIWLSNEYAEQFIPNEMIGKSFKIDISICGQSGTSLSDLKSC